jgi:hypothetical protein
MGALRVEAPLENVAIDDDRTGQLAVTQSDFRRANVDEQRPCIPAATAPSGSTRRSRARAAESSSSIVGMAPPQGVQLALDGRDEPFGPHSPERSAATRS